jgi:hypothetical protein
MTLSKRVARVAGAEVNYQAAARAIRSLLRVRQRRMWLPAFDLLGTRL